MTTDELFNNLKGLEKSDFSATLITENLNETLVKYIDDNPGWNKQQLVENLIKNNPQNKDQILECVNLTVTQQLSSIESKLSDKNLEKFRKANLREDLNELQSLGEDRNINKIKTLKSVNRSHSNLLEEIKKAKTKNTANTDQYENTMNLFE